MRIISRLQREGGLNHAQWARRIGLVIILVAVGWQFIGAWTDSQTTDESPHLVAGYSYWKTNDHRLNPEHPPLLKLLASAPFLTVPRLAFDTSRWEWESAAQWDLGFRFLYQSRIDPATSREVLWLGRMVPILLTGVLIWLVGWWAGSRWGPWAGVISAGVMAFDPTVLGHGHLVTTDIALTLGFLGTVILLERFINRPTWSRLWLMSLVFALTQVTKFSAIILWLIVPLILVHLMLSKSQPGRMRWAMRALLSLVLVTPLVTWMIYGFELKSFDSDSRVATALAVARGDLPSTAITEGSRLTDWLVRNAAPSTTTGRLIQSLHNVPIPAYSYFAGLVDTANHNYWGHSAFFMGDTRVHGWWQYFPVALSMKLPILTLVLLLAIGGFGLRRLQQRRSKPNWSSAIFLGLPPVLFLLWSMTSHINIGVRHVLPVIAFAAVWAGSVVMMLKRFLKWMPVIAIGVSVVAFSVALAAWPKTIGYFNGFFGGSSNGYRLLQDSNLDWNQDTWRLRSYLDRANLSSYALAIPLGRHEMFFSEAAPVPDDDQIAAGRRPHGPVFITAAVLFDEGNRFHWYWTQRPTEVIGTTVYRYDFD